MLQTKLASLPFWAQLFGREHLGSALTADQTPKLYPMMISSTDNPFRPANLQLNAHWLIGIQLWLANCSYFTFTHSVSWKPLWLVDEWFIDDVIYSFGTWKQPMKTIGINNCGCYRRWIRSEMQSNDDQFFLRWRHTLTCNLLFPKFLLIQIFNSRPHCRIYFLNTLLDLMKKRSTKEFRGEQFFVDDFRETAFKLDLNWWINSTQKKRGLRWYGL